MSTKLLSPKSRAPARAATKAPKKSVKVVKPTIRSQPVNDSVKSPTKPTLRPAKAANLAGVPFDTAEDSWFWFMAARAARLDGAPPQNVAGDIPRPCEPIDIYNAIDRLYRGRLLQMRHFRVLKFYGERFMRPDVNHPRDCEHARLWDEAMARLTTSFVRRGIIAARFLPEPRARRNGGVYHVA